MKILFDALSRKPTISVGTISYIISGLQIINRKYPECEFYILSANPDVDMIYLSKLPYKVNLIKRSKTELGTIIQIRRILKKVDVVVSSWGDAYISSEPYLLYRKAFFLKKYNVPMILFTSSIGPFNGGIKDYIAYRGLKKFNVISVRDYVTYNYLKQFKLKNVKLIHDTAFVLMPAHDDIVSKILYDAGLRSNHFVGINISVLLYHKFKNQNKSYIKLMANYINWVKEKFKCDVLLIPHQIFPKNYKYTYDEYISPGGDDRYAIELVLKQIGSTKNVYHLDDYYNPSALKGVIKRCKMFIGGRMHSVIAALSQNIPSLIMQYSHKASGMMKMLELDDYVWDLSDKEENLLSKTLELWERKNEIREKLSKEMPKIIEDIYGLANEIERNIKKK